MGVDIDTGGIRVDYKTRFIDGEGADAEDAMPKGVTNSAKELGVSCAVASSSLAGAVSRVHGRHPGFCNQIR